MPKTTKLIPLSKLKNASRIDSVQHRRSRLGGKRNIELLNKCSTLWMNLSKFRGDRERCKRYVYGDQWGDYVTHKGKTMTEKQYISKNGNVALTNNVMRRLVNTVTGLYVKSQTEPTASARDRDEQRVGEMMSITLQCNWQVNKMPVLMATLLEEYVIGGAVFERESFEFFNGRKDVLSTIPNPNYMFFDSTMSDPRFWDMSLVGEIHDITFKELCFRFAKSEEDFQKMSEMYKSEALGDNNVSILDTTDKHALGRINFYTPVDPTSCRVYEVWTKEIKPRYRCHDPLEGRLYRIELEDLKSIQQENEDRRVLALGNDIPEEEVPYITYEYVVDYYWFFQFMSPRGDVILEGETPFDHESHPYTMSLYPFINGEIHSFANDFLDQQRYINRLITIDDFVRRSGAKGVTLIPAQLKPDDMSMEDFAEQWSSVDGLIMYTPKAGVPAPQQFFSHATNLNTVELVQLQLSMMEDISSVHGAVQGKQAYSGTSAALYSQQSANSITGLATLLLKFGSFVEEIAVKKTKLMQQYYTEKRILNISGKNYVGVKEYDPHKARDIEFDLSIKESASTPTHRMIANDLLMEFWKAGAISIEMMLENGDFPFADSLIQSLGAAKENGMQGVDVDPVARAQMAKGVNPGNIAAARQMLQG